jgi:hypothetical protein
VKRVENEIVSRHTGIYLSCMGGVDTGAGVATGLAATKVLLCIEKEEDAEVLSRMAKQIKGER